MTEYKAYIGLGSNLGASDGYIEKALKMLADAERIRLIRVSELVQTKALGGPEQPDYLNGVAEISTSFEAGELLEVLRRIENELGRVRGEKWAARTIDLDLLLFGGQNINKPDLTVPHPRMHLRSFVLKCLCQLNEKLVHPEMKVSVRELADRLNGGDFMLEAGRPQLISIAGNIGSGKTTLAKNLANRLDCKVLLEAYDTNPFLPEVYAGKKELALDSQLYFLTTRLDQLSHDALRQCKVYISDYVFNKELIYANALLNERQLSLYEDIYHPYAGEITSAVLVIYLSDSTQKCLERIQKRNRPYEQDITLSFLQKLDCGYEELFADWKNSPVIRISTSQLDYSNQANIERLLDQIKCYIVRDNC
ncbi:2-amino-4-hydroxy-6-hydroxymethyldihydropteridine diphosphokinase [Planctomycetota bacterium]